MYNTQANILISTIIITCTLISHSAAACDLDKLNRGQAGHGCTEDTGPGVSDPSINPGTPYKTLIKLKSTSHPGITNPQRASKPGDTVPANSDTRINRFGPPLPAQPDIARRIYLTDGWRSTHGNSSFPLNVKSEAKYEEFKLHLENRDKGHECYFPTTNTAGGCLDCKADWTPANYLSAGRMACGANDTGWRPAIESRNIIPDGKACPRAFYTNACNAPPTHTPPTVDTGRTCNTERNALRSAERALDRCEARQRNDRRISCASEQDDVDDAQQDLDDCEDLPPCRWDYNEGPWSAWKPARSGECPQPFVQTSVRTLNPTIIGNPNQCRHTAPNPPPHQRQRTVTGTRPATDADCGGGPIVPACTTWEEGPWDPALTDTELAAQTCIGDTASKTRTVTPGPTPCTGTPPSSRPATSVQIEGTKQCEPETENEKESNTSPTTACGTTENTCTVNGETAPPRGDFETWDGNCITRGTARVIDEPDTANQKKWRCAYNWSNVCIRGDNSSGNKTESCTLEELPPENGICNNEIHNTCITGTPSPHATDPNQWTCQGINGGDNDNCRYIPRRTQNPGQCSVNCPTVDWTANLDTGPLYWETNNAGRCRFAIGTGQVGQYGAWIANWRPNQLSCLPAQCSLTHNACLTGESIDYAKIPGGWACVSAGPDNIGDIDVCPKATTIVCRAHTGRGQGLSCQGLFPNPTRWEQLEPLVGCGGNTGQAGNNYCKTKYNYLLR